MPRLESKSSVASQDPPGRSVSRADRGDQHRIQSQGSPPNAVQPDPSRSSAAPATGSASVALWRKRDTSPLPDETLRNSRWGTDATRRWWTGAATSAVLVVVGRCLFAWCVFVLAAAALASPSSKADATTTTRLRRVGFRPCCRRAGTAASIAGRADCRSCRRATFQLPASDDDVGTKAIKRMRGSSSAGAP